MAEPRQPQHQPHPPSQPDPRDDPNNQAQQDPNRPREGAPLGQMPAGISNQSQSGGPTTGEGEQRGGMAMTRVSSDLAQLTEGQRQAVQAAGIDWSRLQNINWAQLYQIAMALVALFRQAPPIPAPLMMAAVSGAGRNNASDEQCYQEFAKQHFEMISALAECGQKCCRPK